MARRWRQRTASALRPDVVGRRPSRHLQRTGRGQWSRRLPRQESAVGHGDAFQTHRGALQIHRLPPAMFCPEPDARTARLLWLNAGSGALLVLRDRTSTGGPPSPLQVCQRIHLASIPPSRPIPWRSSDRPERQPRITPIRLSVAETAPGRPGARRAGHPPPASLSHCAGPPVDARPLAQPQHPPQRRGHLT